MTGGDFYYYRKVCITKMGDRGRRVDEINVQEKELRDDKEIPICCVLEVLLPAGKEIRVRSQCCTLLHLDVTQNLDCNYLNTLTQNHECHFQASVTCRTKIKMGRCERAQFDTKRTQSFEFAATSSWPVPRTCQTASSNLFMSYAN